MNTPKPKETYILFHANCFDGTGAKYAAWKKFGTNAKYIAVQYGKEPPEMTPGSDVYILDFSYDRTTLEALRAVHAMVVVIDHHKTAEEALRGLPDCVFDMEKSGAVLAWEYFHPGKPVPGLLEIIQDRDLWRFKFDNTRPITRALPLLENKMSNWNQVVVDEAKGRYSKWKLLEWGTTLLNSDRLKIASVLAGKVKPLPFCGFTAGVTNSTELVSEIGNAICQDFTPKVDFAVIYSIMNDGMVLFSLRSEGDMDVSAVAKKYGGGGHANSCGFRGDLEFLNKLLKGEL